MIRGSDGSVLMVRIDGVRSTWRCLLFGHKWPREWSYDPLIENWWQPCQRDCSIGRQKHEDQP